MAEYRVLFRKSVEKDLSCIPKKEVGRLLNRIKALEKNPRPPWLRKIDWTRTVPPSPGTIPHNLFDPG